MTVTNRCLLVSSAVALVVGLLIVNNSGANALEDDIRTTVDKLAQAIAKNDKATANKLTASLAEDQDNVYETMRLYNKRKDRRKRLVGFGVGEEGKIIPDGIGLKIQIMSREKLSGVKLKKEKAALKEMALRNLAIAKFATEVKPYENVDGAREDQAWKTYANDAVKHGKDFVAAIESGDTDKIKKTAKLVNDNCSKCHTKFR